MHEIAPNVYVESSYCGVTVGAIVTPQGLVCVDSPSLPSEARDWRAQLAALTPKPIRYVIYTNAQRDRILGAQYLGGMSVGHELAWQVMKGYSDAFRQQAADSLSQQAPEAALEVATNLRLVLPHVAFDSQLVLYQGDTSIVLQGVGVPTPCSIWVWLPEHDVLFVGDTITAGTHPVLAEADIDAWIDLLKKLRCKKKLASVVVPGRGNPTCKKSDLQKLYDYLLLARRRVRTYIRSGRSRSDIAVLLPEFLPRFPIPAGERECIQRRVRLGLDHAYGLYSVAVE